MQMIEKITESGLKLAEKFQNIFLIQSQTAFRTMALMHRPHVNGFQGPFR